MEKKLSEQEKIINDLIQRNKELEQFSYIVTHNLRGPVANIRGIFNVMELNRQDEASFKKCVEGIRSCLDRLDEIIIDLNSIFEVRKENGDGRTDVNLPNIVNSILLSIADLVEKEKVTVEMDFSDPVSLYTVKSYLHSILYNLILNSIKYRRLGVAPVIYIGSSRKDGRTVLVIRDNGMGIDLKLNGDKIFGLYKRFHDHVDGKGVGLFMVKTQMDLLGGKIELKSEVGQGSEFTLEFPD